MAANPHSSDERNERGERGRRSERAGRSATADVLFAGRGEMRARCRALDWGDTPLGPVERWTEGLCTSATTVLATGFPAILLWGPELTQIYNDGYVRYLRAKHPVALGMPTLDCWPETRHITEPIYRRVLHGDTVTYEAQPFSLRNGGADAPAEDVNVTISYAPLGAAGAVEGIMITAIDVTEQVSARRIQAERERLLSALEVERSRLAQVFQRAPSFLAVLRGSNQTYELFNEAYAQIIGHRDVIGKPLLDALPELRGQGFEDLLETVRVTGEPWVGRESPVRLQRTPGAPVETRYLDMVFQPLVDADGTRSGVIAHGSDVTDHVLARRELEAANERLRENAVKLRDAATLAERTAQAEAANRTKSEFLAVMSHELRTPLNAIAGHAELLEMGLHGPLTAAQRDAIDRIQRSQRHLLGLINSVLNYAKLDAGAVTFETRDVALDELLATCESLVAPQARARQLVLRYEPCDSAIHAYVDGEKVQQIVLNLLSNAIKFTAPGGAVTVTCGRGAADTVVVRVADTGCGIAADHLERIFQPFVQIDARLTRTAEGTGLGLAISRDLARGMGGALEVTSVPGSGSTFTLTLPVA